MMHLTDKQKTRYDNRKEATYHDMPIEKEFGYAQTLSRRYDLPPEFGH